MNLNADMIPGLCLLIAGAVGAKLLYCLLHLSDVRADPALLIRPNGFLIYGGVVLRLAVVDVRTGYLPDRLVLPLGALGLLLSAVGVLAPLAASFAGAVFGVTSTMLAAMQIKISFRFSLYESIASATRENIPPEIRSANALIFRYSSSFSSR